MKKHSKLKIARYYLEYYITIGIFKIFSKIKIQTASNLCGNVSSFVTKVICKINGRHNTALSSLKLCFPEKTEQERLQILNNFYKNLGRFVGEYITQSQIDENYFKENVEVINPEIFEKYKETGFFGITGHFFGNWELLHHYIALKGKRLNVIYRKQDNYLIEKKFIDARPVNQIPKNSNAMRQIMDLIKKQSIIGILIDQRDNKGERFPFFGVGARTGIAIQRLSLKYNFPMIGAVCVRKKDNPNKFILKFYEPLKIEKTENLEEDIKKLTHAKLQLREEWIKEWPEQWFWIYNRWK